jgi:3-oxoacyl-[acyl-carrier protein] reductase
MRLQGKVAIVTGGAKGIGGETVKLFAAEGARVIACDMIELQFTGSNIEFYKLNVTDADACKKFAEYAISKYKKIDILVNNAGITRDALTRKMTDEQWNAVIDVNLKGVFNITRYIGPHMEDTGSGSIINLASAAGEFGNIGQINYSATKAGVIGMAKTWSKEFARKGAQVRANAIAPGFIKTDIVKTVPQEVLDESAAATSLKRLGEPEEIAKVALFLASDDSSYVTGISISVNGGIKL